MFNSNSTIVGVRLSDRLERIILPGDHDVDEPHIDREYPVVYVSTNDVQNLVINLETGEVVSENDPNNADFADHGAPMRGKIVSINWTVDGVVSIDHLGNVTVPVTPSPTDWHGDFHLAGQWVFNNPSEYFILDQWQRLGDYPIYNGMIGFVSIGGDLRLLAAHDATGGDYDTVPATPTSPRWQARHVGEQHDALGRFASSLHESPRGKRGFSSAERAITKEHTITNRVAE